MLMTIKQILFLLLYLIISLIILFNTGPKFDDDKQNDEQKKIGIIMTIIPLVIIGAISYNLLFN